MRRALAVLLTILALPALGEGVRLPVAEVREAAVGAVTAGEADLARALAAQLLQRDPGDALAHMVVAMAAAGEGQTGTARGAARLAFRHGDTPVQRHAAAMLAASLAGREGRPLAERFWLRQAIGNAPGRAAAAEAGRALRFVRDQAPWSIGLRVSVTPSSNVNGGAADPDQYVGGVWTGGVNSADALAMSGTVGTLQANGGYRLWRDDRTEIGLTAQVFAARVRLSEDSRQAADSLTGSDLAQSQLDLGFALSRRLGETQANVALSFGRNWRGSGERKNLRDLDLGFVHVAGARTFSGGLGLEATQSSLPRRVDSLRSTLRGGVAWRRPNGDQWRFSATAFMTAADRASTITPNNAAVVENRGGSLRVGYSRAKPVGPVSLSMSVGVTRVEYPDFTVLNVALPDGRQDTTISGDLTLTHEEVNWMGFSPQMTLSARRTQSNVSSFTSSEVGVGFGLRSNF